LTLPDLLSNDHISNRIPDSPRFVIGTTMYIYMSAFPFWVGIFFTFNKENYHV